MDQKEKDQLRERAGITEAIDPKRLSKATTEMLKAMQLFAGLISNEKGPVFNKWFRTRNELVKLTNLLENVISKRGIN